MGMFGRIVQRARGREQGRGVEGVTARMRALAAKGRPLEAVAFANPHALRLGDAALHRELAHLRRDAARAAISCAAGRSDWPPRYDDPFPDCDGIPVIDRRDLTSAIMAGAILHHGSLWVRGLLDRSEAQALANDIDRTFVAHDAWFGGTPSVEDGAWFSMFDLPPDDEIAKARHWNRAAGGVLAADSPALINRLSALFQRHGLIDAIETYLGERPMVSVGKTVLRRVDPTRQADFHQDGAFLGEDVRTINVWTALSDCGRDSPGLEIVDRRVDRILQTGTEGAHFKWTVGREVARRANLGRPFARPNFAAGDALIFDQLMLHATSYDPAMSRPRFAVESWFFAPSAYTERQVPLAI